MFPPDLGWEAALQLTADRIQKALDIHPYADAVTPDYLRDAVNQYPRAGGKRMRPALTLWCCGLFGGEPEKAFQAALAVEIYHNWTLVHDDLIDNDNVRRGHPTAHAGTAERMRQEGFNPEQAKLIGDSTAILAGDILQGWAVRELCALRQNGLSADCVLALVERMQSDLGRGLISGEAIDVDLSIRPWNEITPEKVLEMMVGKTGVLLRFAAQSGAAVALDTADLDQTRIIQIGRFAERLGVAFQLRDDWLGLWGDFQQLGKPLGSDLIACKPTLLLSAALHRLDSAQRVELLSFTGNPSLGEKELHRARQLITDSGAETFVRNLSEDYIRSAKEILLTFPESCYRTWLVGLSDYAVSRNK